MIYFNHHEEKQAANFSGSYWSTPTLKITISLMLHSFDSLSYET